MENMNNSENEIFMIYTIRPIQLSPCCNEIVFHCKSEFHIKERKTIQYFQNM